MNLIFLVFERRKKYRQLRPSDLMTSGYFSMSLFKKYDTKKIQNVLFWHEMFKIASLGLSLVPAGEACDAPPDILVARGFLPSAIAALRLRRFQFPRLPWLQFIYPP